MQDKNRDKDILDDFSQLISQRADQHRMPVDAACWSEIESRIKPKTMRRMLWPLMATAACTGLVICMLFVSYNSNNASMRMARLDEKNDPTPIKTGSTKQINISTVPAIASTMGGSKATVSKVTVSPLTNHSDSDPVIDQNSLVKGDTVLLASENKNEIDKDDTKDTKINDSIRKPMSDNLIPDYYEPLLVENKKKKNNKWNLALLVSSAGNNLSSDGDAQTLAMSDMNSGGSSPHLDDQYKNLYPVEDFTYKNHSLPLSFGLMVRKNINKRFGIETGLVYTYLASDFEKTGTPHYSAKQHLHYLGVPLNLVIYAWNDPKWRVYLSAGGMIEKGLQLKYKQEGYMGDRIRASNLANNWIDGVQWSLNSSAGVSYNFYGDLSFYFEPRYTYTFDNAQPISIRTDNKHSFGISGGIRYEF